MMRATTPERGQSGRRSFVLQRFFRRPSTPSPQWRVGGVREIGQPLAPPDQRAAARGDRRGFTGRRGRAAFHPGRDIVKRDANDVVEGEEVAVMGQRFVDAPEELTSPDAMRTMSGLEFLQGIVDGRHPAAPIAQTLGFELTEVVEGRAIFEGAPSFSQYNPIGGVHGGWFGTLLDSCMACAVQSRLPAGFGYTTLEYRVNITRPVFHDGEPIRAIGDTLHVGRRTGAAEGKLIGAETGKLYGFGATTCLVLEL